MRSARSLRCSTSWKEAGEGCTHAVVHSSPFARSARCPWKPTSVLRSDASCRMPSSALSWRESSRARSFLDPSSCGASSRSLSNKVWAGRAIRSKKQSWPTSCTGRERISTAEPIPWFGWTPGAFATNCASTTRADPSRSSFRCRRAATCRSSKRIPFHTPTRLFQLFPRSLGRRRGVPNLRRGRIAIGALAAVATVVAAGLTWRVILRPTSAPAQLLPLASYPGGEGPPALSPDGNLVAFAWSGRADAGATDIYVKAVESEALRRLTDTPSSETSPAWSPDGHSIAFVRDGYGVFTMSQLGGSERQVSASGTQVAWTGDSKSVLIRDREGNGGPFGIHQVFLDTLERRRLTQAPVGAGDYRFEVSPDGSTLAFIRYEKVGIADVYVVPMGGGEPRRLSNWNTTMWGLSWTPDGQEIVYDVDEPPASRLWRIDANSATPARGSPITDIPAAALNPSISRPTAGQPARLAFQTIARDIDLHLMDLDARLVNDTVESRPFSNSTRIEGSARFSPDGSRIAFASLRSGATEVWVAERDGSGLQQVTSLGAVGVLIGGWSPDGTRIAFEAAVAGNSDVYLVGADGGHLRRLTAEPSIDGVPSWSADGRWIYFASTRAGVIADIWRISPGGGEAIRLTRNGGFQPQESPDGRYLFYLDRPPAGLPIGSTARLMRLPLGGGHEELVARTHSAVSMGSLGFRDRVRHPRAGLRCD